MQGIDLVSTVKFAMEVEESDGKVNMGSGPHNRIFSQGPTPKAFEVRGFEYFAVKKLFSSRPWLKRALLFGCLSRIHT
jgi:hypothetical protein